MKILMTTDTVGGVWTYCMELCEQLCRAKVKIYLVIMGKPSEWQWNELRRIGNISAIETSIPLEWMDDPWREIDESGEWMMKLESETEPDLIHLNCFSHATLQWKAPVLVVAHSDVFTWHLHTTGMAPSAKWNEYFHRVSKGLIHADLLVAPSASMLKDLMRIYNPPVPGLVIPNGRNATKFRPREKKDFIFSAGRVWDPAKNIRLLVEAAAGIHYPVCIAGDTGGNFGTDVGAIRFIGQIPPAKISEYMSGAAIYAFPAKYEPFGLSILEAALSGCALVLGNIASLREIWQGHAIYIDTEDPVALAGTVNALMENRDLLAKYAYGAFCHAGKYSSERMGGSYLEAYKKLAGQTQRLRKHENA